MYRYESWNTIHPHQIQDINGWSIIKDTQCHALQHHKMHCNITRCIATSQDALRHHKMHCDITRCIATSQDALRHHKMHCDITRWTTMWQFGYAAVLMAVVVLASKSDRLVGCLSPTPLWLWNIWLFSRCLYSKTHTVSTRESPSVFGNSQHLICEVLQVHVHT